MERVASVNQMEQTEKKRNEASNDQLRSQSPDKKYSERESLPKRVFGRKRLYTTRKRGEKIRRGDCLGKRPSGREMDDINSSNNTLLGKRPLSSKLTGPREKGSRLASRGGAKPQGGCLCAETLPPGGRKGGRWEMLTHRKKHVPLGS